MTSSLIIPCFNEAENLALLCERCQQLSQVNGLEVILVDNGSSDNTQKILNKIVSLHSHIRSVQVKKNQGYGHGILAGLREAKGEILGWTHADMQTDPMDFAKGVEFFNRYGNDIFVKGKRRGRPLTDLFFTIGMSFFETILLKTPLWDINAQPTIFSKKNFQKWIDPPHDFSLDLFTYYMAKQSKLNIHRFPVLFSARAYGVSHWNINWSSKKKFIRRTIQFSIHLKKSFKQ